MALPNISSMQLEVEVTRHPTKIVHVMYARQPDF